MDIVFENKLKPYKLLALLINLKNHTLLWGPRLRSGDTTYGREIPVKTKW